MCVKPRPSKTTRPASDASSAIERERNARQWSNATLRFVSRDVRRPVIFIPQLLPHRSFIARTVPGLIGRPTIQPVSGAKLRVPRRASLTASAGDARVGFRPSAAGNRPVIASSTAVPTLTQRADQRERNRSAARLTPICRLAHRQRGARNVSDLIYAARAVGACRHTCHRVATRDKNFYSGFSRTRDAGREPRDGSLRASSKNAECFSAET